MAQNKIKVKFYAFTQECYQKLKEAKLTASEWRLWGYLTTLIPFTDNYQELPDTPDILAECGIGRSTFYLAISKFQDLELFDFKDRGFKAKNLLSPPTVGLSEKADAIPKNRTAFQKPGTNSENAENQSPEPLPDKEANRPQIVQNIQTSQIGEEIVRENHKGGPIEERDLSSQPLRNFVAEQMAKIGVTVEETPEPPPNPYEEKYRAKLKELDIKWEKVALQVGRAHESQIIKAIAHVEANWEVIRDKTAVFLYQLPKQSIERVGGGRVYRASEGGFSLDWIKKMYPANWKDAAAHFGMRLEENFA